MWRQQVLLTLLTMAEFPQIGTNWSGNSVPRELKPEGTMATYEDGRLSIDERSSSHNVTALTGKQAVLVCVVRNIGNESISWIRHRDTSLIAVNKFIYTTSDRFKVHHQPGTDDWRLSIKPVEINDTGWYSCQVSITPHMEHRMYLLAIQPTTVILGPKDMYIEEGSTINITCIIEAGPSNHNPSFVYWNYNGKIITYDREKGGTVVISERGKTTTSSLIITHATDQDSGKYECDPSASYPQFVNVHVIKIGKISQSSDAVRGSDVGHQVEPHGLLLLLLLLFLLLQHQPSYSQRYRL